MPVLIKEAYLVRERYFIKCRIRFSKDLPIEITILPKIKGRVVKVRGAPSLSEWENLLDKKGTKRVEVWPNDIIEIKTYLVRRDRKDLKDLFSDKDSPGKFLSVLLLRLRNDQEVKLLLREKDALRLKKTIMRAKNRLE